MPGRHTSADYKHHYRTYGSKPEQKRKRALRNRARRKLIKEGKVKRHDGKDIDHKTPLRKSTKNANSSSNLRVTSRKKNRGHGVSPGKRGQRAKK